MVQNLHLSGQHPVRPAGSVGAGASAQRGAPRSNFAAILGAKTEALKFSAHAETRIRSRNIAFSDADRARLEAAADAAAQRGARKCLFLMGSRSFLVSVPNRTVVTALETDPASPGAALPDARVWTDIDSAVVLPEGEGA